MEKQKQLIESLTKIEHDILQNGNTNITKKMKELIEKASSGQAYIALCGHFSAGKSTLINELIGEKVLPSSPIPTSANVVSIQSGKPEVVVHFRDKGEQSLPLHEIDQLQQYCKDGDEVSNIEIFTESDFLPPGISLLDTPGVDSTDEAHQLATASALHLADIVFYVMDYNHVQSEINFQFAKSLQELGKPMLMIVNQIDKHNALELSFSDFVKGVKQGFDAWQFSPLGLFFVSMKDKDHPYNQLAELKQMMTALFETPSAWVLPSIQTAAKHLIDDYGKWKMEQQEQLRSSLHQRLSDSSGEDTEKHQLNQLQSDKEALEQSPQELEKAFKKEMKPLLDNAPIFPYSTTELARQYIESRKPGFKVGFLFTADKTAKEIERRFEELSSEVEKHVTAYIVWHMKEFLIKLPKQWGIMDSAYEEQVRNLSFEWPKDALERVKEGETSREYVYRYTQEVGEEIKRRSLEVGLDYLETAKELLKNKIQPELTTLQEKITVQEDIVAAWNQLADMDEEIELEKNSLISILPSLEMNKELLSEHGWNDLEDLMSDSEETVPAVIASPGRPLHMDEDAGMGTADAKYAKYQQKLRSEAKGIRHAADLIQEIPGFARMSEQLQARALRMENRQFTVALFGAFSAGKSSLANALLGYPVLPVSPHPTTAVINRIVPVSEEKPHGLVHVTMKSKDAMEKDVLEACRTIGLDVTTLEQALEKAGEAEKAAHHASMKPYVSFLKAFKSGYEFAKDKLGSVIETSVEVFSEFVAREERACFVELVDVYYDCPMTRTGMTLVDTPGADSINARHTGVAFEYIKNADAVLFVTYYNHAFSHADRQFLNQLGRVKDAFEMDKMFFLVNAADLAASEEELSDVVNHVSDNLSRHGIRHPRIFPVSSQTALWAKLLQVGLLGEEGQRQYRNRTSGSVGEMVPPQEAITQSGMRDFEEAFYAFTLEELTDIAIKAAKAEVTRAAKRLDEWLISLQADKLERSEKLQELTGNEQKALAYVAEAPIKAAEMGLSQETDELAYYIKQRIGFKFNEMFNFAFNGSDLAEDGRNIKEALRLSLRDLLGQLQLEVLQELRATALRVENYSRKMTTQLGSQWSEAVNKWIGIEQLQFVPDSTVDIPKFPESLKDIQLDSFSSALALFKNGKHFFEGNGKKEMKETLENQLREPISNAVDEGGSLLKQHYGVHFHEWIDELREDFALQINEYCSGLKAVYSTESNQEELQEKKEKLIMLAKEGV